MSLRAIVTTGRRADLTAEEFDRYWRENHARLVTKHAEILGIRRYIQTVPYADAPAQEALRQTRNAPQVDYDGCAELWWDDMESHLAARKTEEGLLALRELIADERQFVDLTQSQLWYGEERTIVSESEK
ncbi:EthD domain-containing protein [Pantoea coffeiphila]|uniref:EthD domain-containing protein n=1 Tax=Pantoea coffeiphila TaxID=1465635 RepID=UPI001960E3A3|nr:EthD domain-containing protein [Pantoea coffeiphila]MBM7343215.1 hypothetical protein [Pantoea coffeiphila]